jgi:DNA polymerase-3 subunit delta
MWLNKLRVKLQQIVYRKHSRNRFMKLDYVQALKRVNEARGAWIIHGQEPLLEQNLLDTFRKAWQQQEVERQRYDISSVNDWKNVFNALNSLSLFSQQLAIEVHGNIKPDANG